MYSREQLSRYRYFERELEEGGLQVMLDPLTGLVSRRYIIGFAQALIETGTPFTFGMLDLDNFKFINDTYGHFVGDAVLANVGEELAAYLEGYGIAGRFGGDELLFINLRDRDYAGKKAFLNDMFTGPSVVRKNVALENCAPFITGTVGCATFPDDAQDYDGLFSLIDKTLYRGKVKGRNCYIIYVEEKHRDIQIRSIARHGVYTSMHSLVRQFEMVPGLKNKLHSVMPLLMEELQITDLYYIDRTGVLRAVRNRGLNRDVGDITPLMNDDLYSGNTLNDVAQKCPAFHAALQSLEVETLMVVRVSQDDEPADGYLVCAEPHSRRIWQEDERAILYFLAKLIAARIRIDGEALDG